MKKSQSYHQKKNQGRSQRHRDKRALKAEQRRAFHKETPRSQRIPKEKQMPLLLSRFIFGRPKEYAKFEAANYRQAA